MASRNPSFVLQWRRLTCRGAPREAGRPAAVAPAGDDARAGGGVARLALDSDGVSLLVGRPRGAAPKASWHSWRGTRHIWDKDRCHFYTRLCGLYMAGI